MPFDDPRISALAEMARGIILPETEEYPPPYEVVVRDATIRFHRKSFPVSDHGIADLEEEVQRVLEESNALKRLLSERIAAGDRIHSSHLAGCRSMYDVHFSLGGVYLHRHALTFARSLQQKAYLQEAENRLYAAEVTLTVHEVTSRTKSRQVFTYTGTPADVVVAMDRAGVFSLSGARRGYRVVIDTGYNQRKEMRANGSAIRSMMEEWWPRVFGK